MDRRELLFHMAEDAFEVLNWARREGLKRDKQLEQVVEAYEKTLADNHVTLNLAHRRRPDSCIDCDGAGKYPSGAVCKSCAGAGRVLSGDGVPLGTTQ